METTHETGVNLTIETGDFTTCYDDLGKGGIPIIFIHGFPFDKSSWHNQIEHLSESQRAIAYDIRGFGKSGPGTKPPGIHLFSKDLIAFMDAMEIDKAIVCGLSMGGYILMNAMKHHPERFEAIVLCDTQCIADSEEAKDGRMKAISKIESDGLMEFADSFLGKAFCQNTKDNNQDLVIKIREVIVNTSVTTVTGTLKALADREEMCSTLDKYSLPVLILCGEDDIVTPLDQSKLMNSKIRNSKLQIISNAGHLSNLENASAFNEQIEKFVNNIQSKDPND